MHWTLLHQEEGFDKAGTVEHGRINLNEYEFFSIHPRITHYSMSAFLSIVKNSEFQQRLVGVTKELTGKF